MMFAVILLEPSHVRCYLPTMFVAMILDTKQLKLLSRNFFIRIENTGN